MQWCQEGREIIAMLQVIVFLVNVPLMDFVLILVQKIVGVGVMGEVMDAILIRSVYGVMDMDMAVDMGAIVDMILNAKKKEKKQFVVTGIWNLEKNVMMAILTTEMVVMINV